MCMCKQRENGCSFMSDMFQSHALAVCTLLELQCMHAILSLSLKLPNWIKSEIHVPIIKSGHFARSYAIV